VTQLWAGVDCGKARHHCVVIGAAGKRLLSRRVTNDEPGLLALIAGVTALGDQVTWAVDLPDGGAALLIGLLVAAGQPVLRGNLHRPKRYHRGLNRVCYASAMISLTCSPASRRFFDRTRAEGNKHAQAVLALARRRVNVLWALIRDNRTYQATPPLRAAA
jgi:hypothetical protein